MKTSDLLRVNLTDRLREYESLRDLLLRERECLISIDPSSVETLIKEMDTVVLRIRLLEEDKTRLLLAYTREQNTASGMTFALFCSQTGDKSLQSEHSRLVTLLQNITDLNDFNRVLTERSLGFTRGALGLIRSLGAGNNGGKKLRSVSREV